MEVLLGLVEGTALSELLGELDGASPDELKGELLVRQKIQHHGNH